MEQIIIRDCRLEDYKAICNINKRALDYDYPEEKTRKRLEIILNSNNDRIFAACMGELVLGYIHGSSYECTYQESVKNRRTI